MNVHRGRYLQRGSGLGSLLAGLGRWLVPSLFRVGKTAVKGVLKGGVRAAKSQAGKQIIAGVKKHGKKAVINAAANMLEGKSVKAGAKENLKDASREVSEVLRKVKVNGNGNGNKTQTGTGKTNSKKALKKKPNRKKMSGALF